MADYPEIDMSPRVLLGPGPSMADPAVLKAMATPLLGHLDPEFLALMDRTQSLLRYVFQTENPLTFPVSGTGSASMEAAVANIVEPGDSVLICINGYFGLRLQDMAQRHGAETNTINKPWGDVFSANEVKQAIQANPADIVMIVHAETSTGVLQPLDDIAKVAHEHDALLLVDAVTSLGGIPVRVDEVGIDVCYSGGQKCLSVPPGASPLTFGPRAVEKLNKRSTKVRSWYLDTSMIANYWGSGRVYHHTAPISCNYALYEGLRLIHKEGLEARFARHKENAQLFWDGLEAMDVQLHVPIEHRLPSLSTVCIPEGVDDVTTRQTLLNDYNIEIAGGLGELKGKVWRVGLMGHSSRKENVLLLLAALEKIIK